MKRLLAILFALVLIGLIAITPTRDAIAQQVINGYRIFVAVTAPGTPASGTSAVYIDSTSKKLCNKDDAGVVSCTGSTAPVAMITGFCSTNITTSATWGLYNLGADGALTCGQSWSATNLAWVSTGSFTLKNMAVNAGATKAGNTYTFTIWQQVCTTLTSGACTAWSAAAATAITCTIGSAGGPQGCSDTNAAHAITVALGDLISAKWASVASDAVGHITLNLEVHQ